MTRSQKVVFIGLGVVALLFIALVIWGQTRPACKGGDEECAKSYEPRAGIKALKSLFGAAAPRIELPQKRYALPANASVQLAVPAADTDMRMLKLRLDGGTQARVTLVNLDRGGAHPKLADHTDTLPLEPRKGIDDTRRLSLAVTKGGATLTLQCLAAPCAIAVE